MEILNSKVHILNNKFLNIETNTLKRNSHDMTRIS